MFGDYEREEIDAEFYAQSEAQNLFEQSCSEADLEGDNVSIEKLRKEGKYVVAYGYDECCPHTDAYIGYVEYIIDYFDNKKDAYDCLDEQFDLHEDINAAVLHPIKPVVEEVRQDTDDEIPF